MSSSRRQAIGGIASQMSGVIRVVFGGQDGLADNRLA